MAADLLRTIKWLRTVQQTHERVLVGVSGGKDSLVTLDLAIRVFGKSNVEGYAMYFLEGMRCFDEPINWAERYWGIPIHRFQHWRTGNLIRNAVFRNPIREVVRGKTKLPQLGPCDIFAAAREKSGIRLIATGERMDDSLPRRGQLHKAAGADPAEGVCCWERKTDRIFPLWDWSARDVFGYLRGKKIPIPGGMGKQNQSGLNLHVTTLRWLREHHPADYAIVLSVFPYADSQLSREDFMKNRPSVYECSACGKSYTFQSDSEEVDVICPHCGE